MWSELVQSSESKALLFGSAVSASVVSYFAYESVKVFPDTSKMDLFDAFTALAKLYFEDPSRYLKADGLAILAAITCALVALSAFVNVYHLWRDRFLTSVVLIFVGSAGLVGAIYFISFFFTLFLVLVVIGLIAMAVFSNNRR